MSEGPNTGFYYYTAQPLAFVTWEVSVNAVATTPGSAWWNSFPTSTSGNRCTRAQLGPLRGLIAEHEGTQPENQPNSHTRVFRDVVDTLGISMIEAAVWGVEPSPCEIVRQINFQAKAHSSKQVDSTSRNPLTLPCDLGLLANP